jgi:hypothetical protein
MAKDDESKGSSMKHHYKKITILAPTVLLVRVFATCGGEESHHFLVTAAKNSVPIL